VNPVHKRRVQYLDLPLSTRLRIVHARLSARLFCWLAIHAPRLAEEWAFRSRIPPRS
jgi:hypothetical protein